MTSRATEVAPVVSDFCFAFNCLGEDVPMAERFAAAQAAGFTQVGLSLRWTAAWLDQGHDLGELDQILADTGMVINELEAVRMMTQEPDPREEFAAMMVERYRPARLQAVGPYDGTVDDAAARAARVADRFAEWGVEVVLEPLPFTNIQTPADAAEIIARAGRPNLSICMDVWHLYRMGLPLSHLDELWPVISTVQFNDGTVEAEFPDDLREDCLLNRRVPGAGEFDLVGLIRERNIHRPDSAFSLEVINTTLKSQDAALSARQIAEGLDRVLTASR